MLVLGVWGCVVFKQKPVRILLPLKPGAPAQIAFVGEKKILNIIKVERKKTKNPPEFGHTVLPMRKTK